MGDYASSTDAAAPPSHGATMHDDSATNGTHRSTDRAVSPVIGVVLMVAITVILAATIGALVFGLSPGTDATAPIASIALEPTDGNVTIIHDGGDDVELNETTLLQEGKDDVHPSGSLSSGQRNVTDDGWNSIDGELVLRHDPSGDILARRDVV